MAGIGAVAIFVLNSLHRHGAFKQLGKNQFGLLMNDSAGQGHLEGTFRIVDRDRVHCIDQNYDAVRVKR